MNKYFVGILNSFHCPTNEIHEIKCPVNKNDFTVLYKTRFFLYAYLFIGSFNTLKKYSSLEHLFQDALTKP